MAINIENELKTQLEALDDKLASMAELQTQRDRIANALGVLTGTLSVGGAKRGPKAKSEDENGDKPVRKMTDEHRLKIQKANLHRRFALEPQNVELGRKIKDVEALLASIQK